MDETEYPRQHPPVLTDALDHAVRVMRATALDYRNSRGVAARRMDKHVRQNMAATLNEYARLIEAHSAKIKQDKTP